jgi:hypothetical protein
MFNGYNYECACHLKLIIMKTNFLVAFILLSVSFFACRKNIATDEMNNQPPTKEILTGVSANNQDSEKPYFSPQPVYWRVSHVMYDNIDMTGNFKAFRFEFLPDQTVVVKSKTSSISMYGSSISFYGKWFMPDRAHLFMYYDASTLPYDIKFEEFFNGEWTILKSSYFGIYMESDENKIHRELLFERAY